MTSPKPKEYSLWVIPYAPSVRRVLIYLREKNIPATLASINHIICPLDRVAYKFLNTEGKPAGSSFPVLKVHSAGGSNDEDAYVMQSHGIMDYFEDVFPHSPRSLRGDTPLERARVRDIVSAESDVFAWVSAHAMFGSQLNANRFTMAESASRDALTVLYRNLGRLEALVSKPVLQDGKWLAGTDQPSLADCVVAADMDAYSRLYGINYATHYKDKYPALAQWFARFEARGSLITDDELPPEQFVELGNNFVFDRSQVRP